MTNKEKVHRRSDGSEIPTVVDATETPSEFPGSLPFTRGIHPTMYRGQLWTMRQYAGFATAEETNLRFRQLLDKGQTGLSVAFDLPTQMGFDPDHAMARGEVGRVGVSVSTLADMRALFKNIRLDQVSTSMTINSTAAILLCFYIALAEEQGVEAVLLRGTIQNDILKEYIARGTFIFPPASSLRLVVDLIEYCVKNLPRFNPISISGYHIREAGSDAVQEVAFTLANALAYSKAALDRGLAFDQFAGQLSFFFASHNDLIEEVAKFRAARRLWAKLTLDELGAKALRSSMLRFHVQTAGSTLTAQQPNNNIARTTIQALAAVLGGCQSLHVNSKDEALALPSEEAATLALRTHHILAEETGVASTVDPVGGSYLIENETRRIESAARSLLDEIAKLGGSVRAIERGYFQRAISERAYQYQREIENEERIIVGVNRYAEQKASPPATLKVNEETERVRKGELSKIRKSRNAKEAAAVLEELKSAARSKENLVPFILAAVRASATLGEISDVLRQEFGSYHATHDLV